MIMSLPTIAHVASIAFGVAAAGLWLWSALLTFPDEFTVGWGGVGGTSADLLGN
jgi:hypothetical protein